MDETLTLTIKVNLDNLTFGDLERFEDFGTGKITAKEIVGLLDRAVEGGVRDLPLSRMTEIMEAFKAALTEAGNPKNSS